MSNVNRGHGNRGRTGKDKKNDERDHQKGRKVGRKRTSSKKWPKKGGINENNN